MLDGQLSLTRYPTRIPGKLEDLFKGGSQTDEEATNTYSRHVEDAISVFRDTIQCEYVSAHSDRCITARQAHADDIHTNEAGAQIGRGTFKSSFVRDLESQWRPACAKSIKDIEASIEEAVRPVDCNMSQSRPMPHRLLNKDKAIFAVHYNRLRELCQELPRFGERTRNELFVCYFCLHETPCTVLACGHALCESCVKALALHHQGCNLENDDRMLSLLRCPLHKDAQVFDPQSNPCSIHVKPEYSGVRILTLDGGGVRGVIELKMLAAVEKALGGRIPVQRFFGLVGGTSTGGLIALGLGTKDWSLAKCEELLPDLCRSAFQKGWSGDTLSYIFYGCRYQHWPFEEKLKEVLGEGRFLGMQVS